MEEEVYLFDMEEVTDWNSWSRDSNLGMSTFQGENPREGASIDFWLAEAGTVSITISDSRGQMVREMKDLSAHAGVNRVYWNLQYEGADPVAGSRGGGGRFGPSGPPAAPGSYSATLSAAGQELTEAFTLRGDPAGQTTQAEYEARTAYALRARDVENRLNGMINSLETMGQQVDGLRVALEGKELANRMEIDRLTGEVVEQIEQLANELRRPPPRMGYRQWPRLSEQLSFALRGVRGAQAEPTEGQLQVLGEVTEAIELRAMELQGLIDGPVAALNRLLEGQPAISVGWSRIR